MSKIEIIERTTLVTKLAKFFMTREEKEWEGIRARYLSGYCSLLSLPNNTESGIPSDERSLMSRNSCGFPEIPRGLFQRAIG
uniref:Uncharacterized protein n=1 Tax=Vespula pensylvanica TaxID=30213 RepID=A0A834NRK3_VESPE|nr:hypothetical protein H0235_011197 [Vespula pensylvanica]